MNRVFLCMWILAVPTCMAIIAVYAYSQVGAPASPAPVDLRWFDCSFLAPSAFVCVVLIRLRPRGCICAGNCIWA